eukprot:1260882-Pleurochrysis_carterae.AAC.1
MRTAVSTVLPLTVPQSSRSRHQRWKTVAFEKPKMKVTNDVQIEKKASQSWRSGTRRDAV